jgi:hypothetical protein
MSDLDKQCLTTLDPSNNAKCLAYELLPSNKPNHRQQILQCYI